MSRMEKVDSPPEFHSVFTRLPPMTPTSFLLVSMWTPSELPLLWWSISAAELSLNDLLRGKAQILQFGSHSRQLQELAVVDDDSDELDNEMGDDEVDDGRGKTTPGSKSQLKNKLQSLGGAGRLKSSFIWFWNALLLLLLMLLLLFALALMLCINPLDWFEAKVKGLSGLFSIDALAIGFLSFFRRFLGLMIRGKHVPFAWYPASS